MPSLSVTAKEEYFVAFVFFGCGLKVLDVAFETRPLSCIVTRFVGWVAAVDEAKIALLLLNISSDIS